MNLTNIVLLEAPKADDAALFLDVQTGAVNAAALSVTKDDSNLSARKERLQDFQRVSNVSLPMLTPKMVDPSTYLNVGETVVSVINCKEVENLPSSTEKTKVTGLISVALILSPTGLARLAFSVAEGQLFYAVDESFLKVASCCFGVGGKASDNQVEYHIQSQQISQDCTVSVDDTLISAFSYRKTVTKVDGSLDEQKSSTCCPSLSCCSCFSCCFCCCPSLSCCNDSVKQSHFSSYGLVVSNKEPPVKHEIERGVVGNASLSLHSNVTAEQEVAVVIHYVNPLSQQVKTCTLKLCTYGLNQDAVYNSARQFVAAVGQFRSGVSVDACKKYSSCKYEGVKRDTYPEDFITSKLMGSLVGMRTLAQNALENGSSPEAVPSLTSSLSKSFM